MSKIEDTLENLLGAEHELSAPGSRVEEILQACLNDEPITTTPQSRVEELLIDVVRERGGVDVAVQELDVNQNGSYTAPMGTAYSPVVVDVVPTLMSKEVTENGTYTATDDNVQGYSEVTVNVAGSGGSSASANDVNFLDYDGTVVYSYSANEALALTEMPANPSRTGLTAQGWNWSLADMKAYVTKYGKCDIGQMYVTDDGKTRLYIYIDPDTPSNRRDFSIRFSSSIDHNVILDWGDGTVETVGAAALTTYSHTYSANGNYLISLDVATGTIILKGGSASGSICWDGATATIYCKSRLKKIEVGNNVTSIGLSAFNSCYSLTSITIPDGVTSIGESAFNSCYSLTSITIPDGITSIEQSAFSSCYSLTSITIPDGVRSIGRYAFSSCYSLTSIAIPDGVTSIGLNAFNSCYSLTSITIPDGITSIEQSAFSSCYSLTSITIPDGVRSIGRYAFSSCYAISEYHMLPTSPPTLSNVTAFTDIASDCIIYVPYSEDHSVLEAYKTATNWSTYASKMQEEPAA